MQIVDPTQMQVIDDLHLEFCPLSLLSLVLALAAAREKQGRQFLALRVCGGECSQQFLGATLSKGLQNFRIILGCGP